MSVPDAFALPCPARPLRLAPAACARGCLLSAQWVRRATVWCLLICALAWAGPSLAAPGLTGTYYGNMTLTAPAVMTRIDTTVNFAWGNGSPGGGVGVDNFSVRWTGFVRVATTGSYTFQTYSDDGIRLWVNNVQIINNWTDHAPTTNNSAAVALTAGVDYPVTLEYYERGGGADARLLWKKPGDATFSAIPTSNGSLGLSTTADATLRASYRFSETGWTGTAGELVDTAGSAGGPFNGRGQGSSFAKPAFASPARFSAIVGGGESGTCGYATISGSQGDVAAFSIGGLPLSTSAGAQTSVAFWLYWDGNADDQVLSFGNYSLRFNGNGHFGFSTGNNDLYGVAVGSTAGGWHHVVAVFTNGSVTANQLYVDNALLSLSQRVGTPLLANAVVSANLSFGGGSASGSRFRGRLDELNVYNDTLSSAQVASLYNATQTCAATLVAAYRFEEAGYAAVAGELKDTAGHGAGPFNGVAQGSPAPAVALNTPARSGVAGTCGYASLPGPVSGGGGFLINNLPLSANTGAQTSVSFWMYWNGVDGTMPVGWQAHDLWLSGGSFGFNTAQGDIYGRSSTGLANGWHHVVAVFTNGAATSAKLYIDGALQALTQRSGSPSAAQAVVASSLRVGGWGASTAYRFAGLIDELKVYAGEVSAAQVASLYAETHICPVPPLDHIEITTAVGSGVTCAPVTFTIKACSDAACSSTYTGGMTGTLTVAGPGMTVNFPSGAGFTIPSGNATATVQAQVTTAGTVTVGATGLSLTPNNAKPVFCGIGAAASSVGSCSLVGSASGFLFDLGNHRSAVSQSVTLQAIKQADNSPACAPVLNGAKTINFKCSYVNPTTGTLPVLVAGGALNAAGNAAAACDAGGTGRSVTFDANGAATIAVQYNDVGRMRLTATYTGSGSDAGLVITGSDDFIAAPADFAVTGISNSAIAAGSTFSATVSARNSAGNTTPNFGRETVPEGATLAFTRTQPTGASAVDGTFSGSLGAFTSGVASSSNLVWTEVGQGIVTASLTSASYLGSGMTASGTASATFKPHHFDVATSAACSAFSYAGQPFGATVTARNAGGSTTLNYDGTANTSPNFARAVTLALAAANASGTLSGTAVAASAFVSGVASTSSPSFAFTSKLTVPQSISLRATDTDAVSSSGYAEDSMALRSGRLRISNAFGTANAALQIPVMAEYWLNQAWVLNTDDDCTVVPNAAIALSNPRNAAGGLATATSSAAGFALVAGQSKFLLAAPTPAGSSLSLDLAINLGSTAADLSCQVNHPASTGAARPWLRSFNGACAATADRDPAGRASFGIFSPESRRTVHVRDIY